MDVSRPDFQDLVENAPCGYITLQANGRVDQVNRTVLDWSGRSAEQMIGKRFGGFLTMPGRISPGSGGPRGISKFDRGAALRA